ncbi:MAG: hypothetical protein LBB40_01625 [Holophagales bacterium]|jgi:hypothetical protein|nr:hypothetical protein [Holophagales bacterium]
MEMKITLPDFKKTIDKMDKQVLFANRLTTNKLMKDIKVALVDEMKRVFDNPVKFTLNSVRLLYAGMKYGGSNERMQIGIIYIDDVIKQKDKDKTAPGHYLWAQVKGGQRAKKPFELGRPYRGGFLVPAHTAPRDRHGNIPAKIYQQIKHDFDARKSGKTNSEKQDQVYIGPTLKNSNRMGVWLRDNKRRKLTPILVWTPKVKAYKKRFKMNDIGERIIKDKVDKYFAESLDHARRTAR